MAIFNEILAGRYSRALQKLFGMKGGAAVRQLAGEVTPSIPFFSGVENRFIETWNRWAAVGDAGPTAANQSGVRIRNPVGSNIIAVIEKLSVCEATGTDRLLIQQGTTAADLSTVNGVAGNRLDARQAFTTATVAPVCIVSQQSSAVALPALGNQFTLWGNFALANTSYDYVWDENQELTILPGDALQFSALTVNVRFLASIQWRERSLEESERQ